MPASPKPIRKTTQGRECRTYPSHISLLTAHTASLPRLRKTSAARGSPILLFASAGHRAGALFKNQSTGVAETGLVLPQTLLDPDGIGDIAAAESEGVGRTGGPLLGG